MVTGFVVTGFGLFGYGMTGVLKEKGRRDDLGDDVAVSLAAPHSKIGAERIRISVR